MDLQARELSIANEVLQSSVNGLIHSLAIAANERDALKARVAELEGKLSPKPKAE